MNSTKWINYFLTESDLVGMELFMAIAIASHTDSDGKAFPGIRALSQKVGRKERQVQNLIRQLEEKGHIEVTRRPGRGSTNVYRLKKAPPMSAVQDFDGTHSGDVPNSEVRGDPGPSKGAIPDMQKVQFGLLTVDREEPLFEPQTAEREGICGENPPSSSQTESVAISIRDLQREHGFTFITDDVDEAPVRSHL